MRPIKPFILALLSLLLPACAPAAISAAMEFDVRTTGNDGNGGAFKRGATGNDYSQQNAAQVSYSDLVVGATTTQVTSALSPFDATAVGNIVNITAGTGCTTGRFEVVSVSVVTATLDRSAGTAASSCTAVLGGSLLTVGAAGAAMVSGNALHIQSGTYTVTATIVTPGNVHFIEGYAVTHLDGGTAPLVTTATDSTKLWSVATSGGAGHISFYNIAFSTTATTKAHGLYNFNTLNELTISKCTFTGFTVAINASNDVSYNILGDLAVFNSEFSTGTQAINTNGNYSQDVGNVYIYGTYIHGYTSNTGAIQTHAGGVTTIAFSVLAANVAAVGNQTEQVNLINTNVYANTGNSIVSAEKVNCVNSIFYGNAGGSTQVISQSTVNAGEPACGTGRNNAFGGNTKDYATGTVAGLGQITLTADPFTSSTNFTLNSTAGGGALLKAAGFVPTVPGSTASATLDVGAIQTAPAVSGGQTGAAFTQ